MCQEVDFDSCRCKFLYFSWLQRCAEIGRRKIRFFFAVCVSRFLAVSGEWQAALGDGEVGKLGVLHLSSYYRYSRPRQG